MMTHQELLRYFYSKYPKIVKQMRESDHAFSPDKLNPFHLEGNIWEHTLLVFHEAVRRGYNFETQLLTLLHDLGKPAARIVNEEKQKVTFYSHEALSIFFALQIMEDLKLPFDVRERIVKVIGLHTEVFKQPLKSLYELIGDEQTVYSLMKLANCDHSGRFADDISPVSYTNYCYDGDYKIFDNTKRKSVTLMVGLPYSGKSTISSQYLYLTNGDVYTVSRDRIIESLKGKNYNDKWSKADQKDVDKELQKQFNESKKFENVIVDMTHMSAKSRRKTLSHFGKDWIKNCVVLLPTLETISDRQELRTEKVIDNSVMDAMIKSFRPPCLGEGFDNIEYRF